MNQIDYDLFMTGLFAKAEKSGIPLSGSFELTSRCTLKCKMCYIHRSENDPAGEKSTDWWLKLAEKAKNAGMLMLLLTGGEPLIRSDFDEIYSQCHKMGIMMSVNTNGMLIDEDKVRLFESQPPKRVNVSVYGSSADTYEQLCGNSAGFEKAYNAVRLLKNAGVNVKINYSITPQNREDLASVYAFAKELDVPVQPVSYMFSPVRADEGDTVRLSPENAAKAMFDWHRIYLGDEGLKDFIRKKQTVPVPDSIFSDTINCRAGLSTLWVTWQGKMTPCGMMTEPCADAEDFETAWQMMRNSRKDILLPTECKNCSLRRECDMCAASSKAETGKYGGLPLFACKKAHEYNRLCEEFLKQGK